MTSKIVVVAMLLVCVNFLSAQSFKEKITKSYQFEKKSTANAVMIFNINGDVEVSFTKDCEKTVGIPAVLSTCV